MPPSRSPSPASDHSFTSSRDTLDGPADSTAALILVRDDDGDRTPTGLTHDDDAEPDFDDEFEEELFPPLDRIRTSPIPDLSPSLVFHYMLAPCLKLGALLATNPQLPLRVAIPALFFFAALSVFARQIWYMLARYVGKADMEDILLDTFARGRGKERRRALLRSTVRFATALVRVTTMVLYFRVAVDALLPHMPDKLYFLRMRPVVGVIIAAVLLPMCLAPSLATRRAVYSSTASLVLFVAWLASVSYAFGSGTLPSVVVVEQPGSLWQGITVFAFAFTTAWSLPLYSALKRAPTSTAPRIFRWFRTLSLMSLALAALFVLPLLFFGPAEPPVEDPQPLMAFLAASALVLGIPAFFITTPPLAVPLAVRRATRFPVSKALLFLLVCAGAFLPRRVEAVLADVALVLALSGTYFLPALLHIVQHTFKRPLAIVVPRTPLRSRGADVDPFDDLLQRKEQSMQRRRVLRRVAWDVGVWVLLLPVGGGGYVWAAGRLAGRW